MISVCMTIHNGERFLKKQIDSILSQLDNEDELIVSDDGSSDNSVEIIKGYNDSRIKLLSFKQPEELKKISKCRNFYLATKNFENALMHARGDFIFLADQDDVWQENKVAKMKEQLASNDIVMSNFAVIDAEDRITNPSFYNESPVGNSLLSNIIKSKFIGCCMAFNKDILNAVLPFPPMLIAHDYWIGCLGSKVGKYCFIEEPLHLYRRYGENVSSSSEKSNNSLLFRIKFRFDVLLKVNKRLRELKGKNEENIICF